jgi:drug/metabolite transporter (DMT)-like permease
MKCEGDFSEGGPGIVWIYYFAYVVFIGIGVMIYTLGLSIQAYKYKKNLISVLSIFISLTPIWSFCVQLLIEHMSMQ